MALAETLESQKQDSSILRELHPCVVEWVFVSISLIWVFSRIITDTLICLSTPIYVGALEYRSIKNEEDFRSFLFKPRSEITILL